MRAKCTFLLDQNGVRKGEIIEATGVNLLQCHADATMQFMRKYAAKIKPGDLKEMHAEIIPDGTTDAAEMDQTRRDLDSAKIPVRWSMPGQAQNEGQ